MRQHHALLALVLAGASLPAVADTALPDPAVSYTDVVPYTDLAGRGATPWKGSLTRAEVTAAFIDARAKGLLASGEAGDDPLAMQIAAERSPTFQRPTFKRSTLPVPQAMGAAAADPVSGDGLRFVGGEAGYAPKGSPEYR